MRIFRLLNGVALLVSCMLAAGESRIVFQDSLGSSVSFAEWIQCRRARTKGTSPEIRQDASGGYLRLGTGCLGVFHKLPKEIVLDDTIAKLELVVELRLPDARKALRPVVILTSRDAPEPLTHRPFHVSRDSGIVATGYQFNGSFAQRQANFIQVRRNGECVKVYAAHGGKNGFLNADGGWQQWVLTYDVANDCLTLVSPVAVPSAELHQVRLLGETIRGVWLAGDLEFRNLKISIERQGGK